MRYHDNPARPSVYFKLLKLLKIIYLLLLLILCVCVWAALPEPRETRWRRAAQPVEREEPSGPTGRDRLRPVSKTIIGLSFLVVNEFPSVSIVKSHWLVDLLWSSESGGGGEERMKMKGGVSAPGGGLVGPECTHAVLHFWGFFCPSRSPKNPQQKIIKRVIGLEGDFIR